MTVWSKESQERAIAHLEKVKEMIGDDQVEIQGYALLRPHVGRLVVVKQWRSRRDANLFAKVFCGYRHEQRFNERKDFTMRYGDMVALIKNHIKQTLERAEERQKTDGATEAARTIIQERELDHKLVRAAANYMIDDKGRFLPVVELSVWVHYAWVSHFWRTIHNVVLTSRTKSAKATLFNRGLKFTVSLLPEEIGSFYRWMIDIGEKSIIEEDRIVNL